MAERSQESGAAMGQPVTRYARAGDVNIAYQVVGDGPVDLVWAYGLASNVEVFWEEPSLAAFFRRLAEFTRLILFDRRGCGLSDRHGTTATPTLEERMEDVLAVLDAVGSHQASILGISDGGSLAALFAATHPERTARIILYGTLAHYDADARYLAGVGDGTAAAFAEAVSRGWGMRSDWAVQIWAPSMAGDEPFTQWLAKYARQSVSRGAILPLLSAFDAYDLAGVFPAVRVPTLVLHRRGDGLAPVSHGRHVASQIPDARFVELEGVDHLPFVGDAEAVLAEVQDFLVGSRAPIPRQRRLLTLVFTNIADSTPKAVDLGDDAWREVLAAHDRDVRTHLTRFGGEEVKQLGNGVLAVFDGPARAIRCALGIVDASDPKGLSVRVGVHTGECETVDADVRGVAVQAGARVLELAAPGQILVSSTVRDLVAGSGIRFGEGRDVELAGMPGTPRVFPVLRHGASPEAVRRSAVEQANLFRRDGEYWTVGYRGLVVTLRDTKGLRDLGRLLAEPGREFHVLDLMAEGTGARSIPPSQAAEAGLAIEGWGEPIIDRAARAHYKRRITELEQELEEAQERGGREAGAAAREELDTLITELTAAYGLAGRPRRSPDPVERGRKAVSRRIRNALSRIAGAHPRLGRHLAASIRTGVFCSYQPERDTVWSVHANTIDPRNP
jgi:pimeloyl-ACP methyl ester carboxylesterase